MHGSRPVSHLLHGTQAAQGQLGVQGRAVGQDRVVERASAEWLNGAVAGSVPCGQAPSMTKAPGTCSKT